VVNVKRSGGTRALWVGIDIGTQSVRAIAADEEGTVVASASQPLVSGRRSGREHVQDPEEWWRAVCGSCREMMAEVDAESVRALALDATSGTILLTDDHLRPASEALMYDDGRAGSEAREVAEAGRPLWAEFGYGMQPSWALPKLVWLWRNRLPEGTKVYLTHQSDFIQNRLAGRRIASDWSHSLKSGYDLARQQWPHQVFDRLGLPDTIFPEVVPPGSSLGSVSREAAEETGLPPALPMIAGMTDGCAAQIAATGLRTGSWNSVLGTTLVLKGATETRLHDPHGVVYSHRAPDGRWLPGGASSTGAGSIAKHFRKEDLDQLRATAGKRGPTDLVVYPLHGTGERFPFVAPEARAFQLREPQDEAELYRAILQGVAFVERLSFDYLKLLGTPVSGAISISGGAVRDGLWNQIRADVLERSLTIPAVTEPAFGMAMLAAWQELSPERAGRMIRTGSRVDPALPFAQTYGATYRRWSSELEARGWLQPELAAYSNRQIEV
jgi:D-ribulokinase